MLAIPRNVCALRNHQWQHGSGKLVKSRMHCKFRWNFCFHRSLYNDLSQSDTWRGTSGRKENTNPAEPDSTVLRWTSFQISNLKDFILDCWKLSEIPKFQLLHFLDFLSQHRNAAVAAVFFHLNLHFRNDFLKALGTTFLSKAPLTLLWEPAKLPSWLLHEKCNNVTWLSRDPFFEPPPLSNL